MVLMKREYIPYCIILCLIVILTSSCESYSSLDEVNCADCLSFEPLDADLYISVTIDSKYKDVPVVILKGKLGSSDTVVVDTITNQMAYIPVPLNDFYTVIAEYNTGTKIVKAVDGDEISKYNISNKCGDICWIIRGGIIDVRLNFDD